MRSLLAIVVIGAFSTAWAVFMPSRQSLSHYRVTFERQEDGTGDVVSLSGWVRETEIVVGRNKVDVTAVVEAGYGSVRNVTVRRLRRL